MERRTWLALFAALPLAAPPAAVAGELYPFGHFDLPSHDDGWTATSPDGSLVHRADLDADNCANSGAEVAENVSLAPEATTVGFTSCIAADKASELYRFGARVYFPEGQDASGDVRVELRWSDSDDCSSVGAPASTSVLASAQGGEWLELASESVAPIGATAARITIHLTKQPHEEPLQLRFDRVSVRPARELFVDGMEIGAACRWDRVEDGGEV
jgi:hypothetical protein